MSVSRHLLNLLTFDSSIFAKEAVKTTLLKSQGAMNFLFVRIYKTANVEYLEKTVKDNYKSFNKYLRNTESALVLNTHYYYYLMKREKFKQ